MSALACCNDARFSCYQKGPHFALCMKRDTCVAGLHGSCEELGNELGQATRTAFDALFRQRAEEAPPLRVSYDDNQAKKRGTDRTAAA